MKRNTYGRQYINGSSLSSEIKSKIIDLFCEGKSIREIGRTVGVVKWGSIRKVIDNYGEQKPHNQGRTPLVATDDVKLAISFYKSRKPSITAKKLDKNC